MMYRNLLLLTLIMLVSNTSMHAMEKDHTTKITKAVAQRAVMTLGQLRHTSGSIAAIALAENYEILSRMVNDNNNTWDSICDYVNVTYKYFLQNNKIVLRSKYNYNQPTIDAARVLVYLAENSNELFAAEKNQTKLEWNKDMHFSLDAKQHPIFYATELANSELLLNKEEFKAISDRITWKQK